MSSTPQPGPPPITTAGALRVLAPRSTRPPVEGYIQATTAHCPYLAPSIEHGMTSWTVYALRPGRSLAEAEEAVFAAAVEAAERVRVLANGPRGSLVCENIAVLGAGREHLDWPHWALKHLYGPVGVMVGKFWAGEEDTGLDGRTLPVPPITFLSLRPAVRPRDPCFLDTTPTLADAIRTAADDGRDVFTGLSPTWKEVRAWASSLPSLTRPVKPPKPLSDPR